MAQFNGTVEQLEKSVAQTEGTADYIIDSGTVDFTETDTVESDTWHYQIYQSGYKRLFCTLQLKNNLTLSNSFGSLYIGKIDNLPSYPTNASFSEYPSITVNTVNADGGSQYDVVTKVHYGGLAKLPTIALIGDNVTIGHPKFSVIVEGY